MICVTNHEEADECVPILSGLDLKRVQQPVRSVGGRVLAPALISLSPDRKSILTAGCSSEDPTAAGPVCVWELAVLPGANLTTMKPLRTLEQAGRVYSALLLVDGRAVLGGADGKVLVYGADGRLERKLTVLDGPVTALATGNGEWLAAASGTTVRVWKLTDGAEKTTVNTDHAVTALAASPNGALLAVGDTTGAVRLYDTTGRVVGSRKGLTGPVSALGFSADGKWLAGGTRTGGVQVWDSEGRFQLKTWVFFTPVTSLAFSADVKLLAAGLEGGGQVLDIAATRRELELPSAFTAQVSFSDDRKVWVLNLNGQSSRTRGMVEVLGEEGPFGKPRLELR